MAKGKHSVALFEVIQAGRSSSRATSLRTPKWWFKSKKADPAGSAPAPVEPVVDESSAPAPRTPGVDLALDPDRKRIKFDVSYTSAIVAAFTVIVVVGLAYVIGSHMTGGPASAIAGPSTGELLGGPPQPGVLKVGSNDPIIPPMESSPKTDRTDTITTPPKPVAPPAPPVQTQLPAPPPVSATQREGGLNYMVLLSFPKGAKDMAFELSDYFTRNGVPCTVESNLPDYRELLVVVGLQGFPRIRSDDFRAYETKVRNVAEKLSKDKTIKNARFMRVEQPAPRQWKGTEKTVLPD